MLRRDLLAGGVALAFSPAFARAQVGMRARITDVRVRQIRLVRELGQLDNTDFMAGMRPRYRVGGQSIVEVLTDQGVIGIGPGVDPASLPAIKTVLVGQDPFRIETYLPRLYGRGGRGAPNVEIAIWDLMGKLANQPLYALWGGAKDRVPVYASFMTTGSPEERAALAMKVKAQGFTGLKLRASFPQFRQDVRLVEVVRKAVGDDFKILVDGNKAWGGNLHMWDFRRAADTARAYQDLGVYWLEEPLPQYDVEHIAELNRKIDMPLAGGENTSLFNDFLQLIDARAYDVLNCEIQFTGPHMARRIQAIAAPRAISIAPHFGDGLLATICQHHLVASWDNAPIAELIHEPPVADFTAIWSVFEKPPVLEKDGTIRMPTEAGLGVSIKPDLLSPV